MTFDYNACSEARRPDGPPTKIKSPGHKTVSTVQPSRDSTGYTAVIKYCMTLLKRLGGCNRVGNPHPFLYSTQEPNNGLGM